MRLSIISYLFEKNINVNQMAMVPLPRPKIDDVLSKSELIRRRSHIVDFALYLYAVERKHLIKQKRMEVVKHLLKMNHVNITNYVHKNIDKIILVNRRSPYVFQKVTIQSALIEMGIDPITLQDKKADNRTAICCFQ